jgi:hypothetical protein
VALTAVMASGANAQEKTSNSTKLNSVGPAIEFSGGGTSFGIKGKIKITNPGVPLSFRPIVLFGYTPNVSGGDFGKAVANGVANSLDAKVLLTLDQKRAIVRQQNPTLTLTNADADALLAEALAEPAATRTPAQNALIAATIDPVPVFTTLTSAQQRAQVKLFTDLNLNDQQADDVANRTSEALAVAPASRTAEQNILVDILVNAVGDPDAQAAFITSTSVEKRAVIKTVYNGTLSDALADTIATFISNALLDPNADQTALTVVRTVISLVARTEAVGFTPGSGVAYGAAVTYDFESTDKKLSGYIGPRVLFASGSSKAGNFDTNTNETNIGLLVGTDYAISPDFTVGLSGTYNFSKTGTLDVSGSGGFKGSSSVSGSSFDVGINFGYRF